MRGGELRNLGPHGFHRTRYWEWGDPANPHVVICVHGLTRNGRDFDVLAQALAPHFRVICPDVVGRGRSDWLPHKPDYGYPLYLSDLTALIARAGVDSVLWVGTSMGGLIGMMLAAQSGNPIRKLVVNDVGPLVPKAALERLAQYVGKAPPLQRPRPVRGVPAAGAARPSARSPTRSGGTSPRPRRSATTTAPSARRTIPESPRLSQAS